MKTQEETVEEIMKKINFEEFCDEIDMELKAERDEHTGQNGSKSVN